MCGLELHFFAFFYESMFEAENPRSSGQARLEFLGLEWLDQVVIGSRLQACHDVFLGLSRCEQHHVYIRLFVLLSDFPANAWPIQLRHDPVQQGKPWSVRPT